MAIVSTLEPNMTEEEKRRQQQLAIPAPSIQKQQTVGPQQAVNKPATNLPYVQNNSILPIIQQPQKMPQINQGQINSQAPAQAQPGTQQPGKMPLINGQSINSQTGQQQQSTDYLRNLLTENKPDAVQQETQRKTLELLGNPSMGTDYNKYNQNQMEQFRRTQNQNIEAQRRAMADVGTSGINVEKLYNLALKKSVDEGNLQNSLEMQANQQAKQDYLNALTAGGQYTQQKNEAENARLQALLGLSGQEQQNISQDKQREYDAWKTQREQELTLQLNDRAAVQAQLDRESKEKLAQLGITAQTQQQDKQLAFDTWKAGREQELAKQGLDQQAILKQMEIESAQKMQQLGLASQEKIAFANLDVEQKKLAQQAMQFGSQLDWEKSAFAQNLSQEDKKMLWQAAENEKDRVATEKLAQFNLTGQKELEGLDIQARKDIQDTLLKAQKDMQDKGLTAEAQQKALDRMLTKELQVNEFANSKEMAALNQGYAKELQGLDAASKKELQTQLLNMQQQMQVNGFSYEAQQKALDRTMQKELQFNEFKNGKEMQAIDNALKVQMQNFDAETQSKMQRELFDNQKYMQSQGFSNDQIMAKLNKDLQLELQAKEFENNKTMQALDQAGKEKLQGLDSATQKEIQANLLTAQKEMQKTGITADQQKQQLDIALQKELQNNALAQEAKQFDSKQKFDEWALQKGLDAQAAQRVWQSRENQLDRTHQQAMQTLQQQFELQGQNYQAFMSQIDKLPPDQQAAAIQNAAIKTGLTYQDNLKGSAYANDLKGYATKGDTEGMAKYLKSLGASEEDATKFVSGLMSNINNPGANIDTWLENNSFKVTRPGLKPSSQSEQDKVQQTNKYKDALQKFENNQKLSKDEYEALKTTGSYTSWPVQNGVSAGEFMNGNGSAAHPYRMNDNILGMLDNVGKSGIVRGNTGELYQVVDYWNPGEKDAHNATPYAVFKNIETGKEIKIDKYSNWIKLDF